MNNTNTSSSRSECSKKTTLKNINNKELTLREEQLLCYKWEINSGLRKGPFSETDFNNWLKKYSDNKKIEK